MTVRLDGGARVVARMRWRCTDSVRLAGHLGCKETSLAASFEGKRARTGDPCGESRKGHCRFHLTEKTGSATDFVLAGKKKEKRKKKMWYVYLRYVPPQYLVDPQPPRRYHSVARMSRMSIKVK